MVHVSLILALGQFEALMFAHVKAASLQDPSLA